jgi:hypothetical protein
MSVITECIRSSIPLAIRATEVVGSVRSIYTKLYAYSSVKGSTLQLHPVQKPVYTIITPRSESA